MSETITAQVLGGPHHGEWVTLGNEGRRPHTLMMHNPLPPLDITGIEDPIRDATGVTAYTLTWFKVPGWRIALPFWKHPSVEQITTKVYEHSHVAASMACPICDPQEYAEIQRWRAAYARRTGGAK